MISLTAPTRYRADVSETNYYNLIFENKFASENLDPNFWYLYLWSLFLTKDIEVWERFLRCNNCIWVYFALLAKRIDKFESWWKILL